MADTRDLLVRIKGDSGDFEKSMGKVDKHSREAGLSFGKMAAAVAAGQAIFNATTAAIGHAVGFIKDSVKEYQEAEAAQKELQHAVLDVSHATQAQLEATDALAESLSKKGVLDDDVIRKGLAQLSTFGLTNKSVQKLAGSMADLTVNQFGVSASGEQAVTAANIMAKALNGNFGALEKMGIHLTNTQRQLIKFGNEAQRVDTINEVMAANLRTSQATALQTTEGKIAHLKVAYGNLKESIGKATVDALTPFVSKALEFVNKVDWEKALGGASKAVETFGKNVYDFSTTRLKPLITDVTEVAKKVAEYLIPKFESAWKVIRNNFIPAVADLVKAIGPAVGAGIVWALGLAIDAFKEFLKIVSPIIEYLSSHKEVVIGFAVAIGTVRAALFLQGALSAFQGVMSGVTASYTATGAAISGAPIVMPALAIGAALGSIAAVYMKYKETMNEIQKTEQNVKASLDSFGNGVEQLKSMYYLSNDPAVRERAKKGLHNLGVKGFAAGTDNAPGGMALVGEKGPELVNLPRGAQVVPNDKLGKSMGNLNITVNMGMYAGMPIEKRQIAVDLYREIVREARANGTQLPIFNGLVVQ